MMANPLGCVKLSGRTRGLPALLVLGCALPALAGPQPIIPKEQIPEDMPADVRRHVEELYSGKDPDQINAANALGHMGSDAASAAPFLASMLRDPVRHGNVGWSSAHALIRIGDAAVEPTILAFQMGNRYARMRAHKPAACASASARRPWITRPSPS